MFFEKVESSLVLTRLSEEEQYLLVGGAGDPGGPGEDEPEPPPV